MSTNINISVGDNKLLAQASLQQNASRQAQLEKEANQRLATQATTEQTSANAAAGLNANGNPLIGTRFQTPRVERRPAANRFGVKADFYVIEYGFTTGRDLDTRTTIQNPEDEQFAPVVGWCKNNQIDFNGYTVVTWGGDNTGTGVESILFDRIQYALAFPQQQKAVLSLSAFWYGERGNSVLIKVTGYKGGEMVKTTYSWENPTATKTWDSFSTYTSFDVATNVSDCIDGDFITYATIDYSLGKVRYSPSLTP